MERKRKLKNWVKILLFMIPEIIIIIELFIFGLNLKNIIDNMPNKRVECFRKNRVYICVNH